jgi:hypothetical protein
MSLLFGEDYKIKINFIKYSTNTKSYIIDCKLYVKDPQLCMETYPVGLEMIVQDSWKLLSMDKPIFLSSTIDLVDN